MSLREKELQYIQHGGYEQPMTTDEKKVNFELRYTGPKTSDKDVKAALDSLEFFMPGIESYTSKATTGGFKIIMEVIVPKGDKELQNFLEEDMHLDAKTNFETITVGSNTYELQPIEM